MPLEPRVNPAVDAKAQKTIAKAKSKSKSDANNKLHKVQCQGCGKLFDADQMANGRYCRKDKKVTDR
eukprot:11163461-Lingulodinium_polyedra.AAC.1